MRAFHVTYMRRSSVSRSFQTPSDGASDKEKENAFNANCKQFPMLREKRNIYYAIGASRRRYPF